MGVADRAAHTAGLHLPRANVLPDSLDAQLDNAIRRSIGLSRENPEVCLPYIRSYAQEITADVLQAHIDTFVNEFSLDLGGKRA